MKAHLRHVDGHIFLAKSDSNHWIPIDTGTASGGTAAASDPFQLFIIACGGCAFIDVVDILAKSRKTATRLELEVEAKRAETIPKILRKLNYHFLVDGEQITPEILRRAIELSLTKYCSVSLSLDRTAEFSACATLNGSPMEKFTIPRDSSIFGI